MDVISEFISKFTFFGIRHYYKYCRPTCKYDSNNNILFGNVQTRYSNIKHYPNTGRFYRKWNIFIRNQLKQIQKNVIYVKYYKLQNHDKA